MFDSSVISVPSVVNKMWVYFPRVRVPTFSVSPSHEQPGFTTETPSHEDSMFDSSVISASVVEKAFHGKP